MQTNNSKFRCCVFMGAFIFAANSAIGAEDAPAQPAQPHPEVKTISLEALADNDPKVKFRVTVQLAGRGKSGYTLIEKKKDDGTWSRIDKCASSNSYATRVTESGDKFLKTPAGRFQPLDTSNKLLYNGAWDSHGPATYYYVLQSTQNENKRAYAAIHNGHVAGNNSHGCVRTENDCAREVREFADGIAEEIPVAADQAAPKSLVFSAIEANLFGQSLGISAKTHLDYSAMVLNLVGFEGTDFE